MSWLYKRHSSMIPALSTFPYDVVLGVLNYTIHCTGWSQLHLLGYALYGICHIGVVTLCKTDCGGSYYHHQRNHNLLHTLLYIKRVILHVPRSTNHSLLSLPDYEYKSKKIISILQISKLVLYEMPSWMYQMTKRMLDITHQASVLKILSFPELPFSKVATHFL